jgi:alkylation response protein AidB-like acyl-CoA dehydrogenase
MPAPTTTSRAVALQALRPDLDDPVARTAGWARAALDEGLLDLPLPARGATTVRFAALADLGTVDLDLARLAEAHVDAMAILSDVAVAGSGDGLWGVWAANPPTDPLQARRHGDRWLLDGTKPWCSGAGCCDYALVTARTDDGYRLFAVDLAAPGATPVDGSWPAAAMQGSDSRSVRFEDVSAVPAGGPDDYLQRPGFWHGAVGVAAVWWGGARGVARALSRADSRRPLNPHALAHAGAVDAALAAAWAALAAAAACFDDDPADSAGTARLTAARARAAVESAASEAVGRTGRALCAAPLALDTDHGRRVADLGLYLRQSHAERDLEELGRQSLDAGDFPWADPDGA